MLPEEVKPEDTLSGAFIYVSRRSQTGRYHSRGFFIDEVKPKDTLSAATIYSRSSQSGRYSPRGFSRSSQTGRYSPRGFYICQQKKSNRKFISQGFHICQEKQSNRKILSQGLQQKQSNRKILSQGLPYMLAEVVKPEYTLPWDTLPGASIYVSRRSQTGIYSPMGFHLFQQKKSNRMILAQGLPFMLAEEVKPEDTLPAASIYVSRRSQTGRYSPSGFHIQQKSNRKILSEGLPHMLPEEVKPEDTLSGAFIYVSRRSQTGRYHSRGFFIDEVKPKDTLSAATIYSRRSQTGRYSPRGFHIWQQKKSNRKILSQGLPYMSAEEVKPEVPLPGASIYVRRSSQTGRYSPRVFHICQQKQSNRNILSHGLPYMLAEEVKPEDTLPAASIYVRRRSQTGRYSPRGFQQKKSNQEDTLPGASIYVSRRSQTGRYSHRGFHICQQKMSNRKILSQGLPYMSAEEVKPEVPLPGASSICQREVVKPEDTLPGSSIYVSRSSQTGIYSPMGFHICQQKKSNRKILAQGLPYMLAEEVKPEDTLPAASIYVSRRSQTGRYSPRGFHICQQKKSNRKILSQRLPYIAEVKPEDTLRGASTYVTRRSQTGRYSLWGFHICQQKKSNRKIPFKGLLYRRSQTERYSLSGYHIQQKKSNRKILSQGLPYMLAEEVKPEDTLPGASIYVSRRSQTGTILSQGLPYMAAEVVKPEYTLPWASIYVSRSSQTGMILSQGLPYMLAEEVKPEDTLPAASIYVSRRSQPGR